MTRVKYNLKSQMCFCGERKNALMFLTQKLSGLGWIFNVEVREVTKHELVDSANQEGFHYHGTHYLAIVGWHAELGSHLFFNEQELLQWAICNYGSNPRLGYMGTWDSLEDYLRMKLPIKLKHHRDILEAISYEKLTNARRSDFYLFDCDFSNKRYAIFERGEK